jgi:hypothetical protein
VLLRRVDGDCLLGVRESTPLEDRHVGVLSTLTRSIPLSSFEALLHSEGLLNGKGHDGITALPAGRPVRIGRGDHAHDEAAFAIEYLLATKAGLAEPLITGTFQATAMAVTLARENVGDPVTEEWQHTTMLSYFVNVESGADLVPRQTAAYNPLIWAPQARLAQAVREKNPHLLDDTLDPFRVCLHGLCVRSAAVALAKTQDEL